MRSIIKVLVLIGLTASLLTLTKAQNSNRYQRKSTAARSQRNNEPIEQGRTLGLIRPLLGLGLSSIARPLVGYDVPYVPTDVNRPSSGSSSSAQSDPYFSYGNYGGYIPNYYNAYNYYNRYPYFRPRPVYPYYNAYRPPIYPAYNGNYPQYNGYGGQRPVYSNSRPNPITQRPIAGQQPVSIPSIPSIGSSTGTATSPVANSAQASQIANLLGQLLGQQLRPLLSQGAASPAHDEPGIAPSEYQDKSNRNRYPYYRG